jgi:hypothetical protein
MIYSRVVGSERYRVCTFLQYLNFWTDLNAFHETRHEGYDTRGHSVLILPFFPISYDNELRGKTNAIQYCGRKFCVVIFEKSSVFVTMFL